MASKELIDAVSSYEEYIKTNGITEELINAYVMATQTALAVEKDIEYGLKVSERAKNLIKELVRTLTGANFDALEEYAFENKQKYDLIDKYYLILKEESFYKLESFIEYMERKREPSKRFYLPRKETLHVVMRDLEDLAYRKIKFYGLSMPSRTGKSTICIFFLCWIALKRPNSHSAMGGHSGLLAKGFYKELMNFIDTEEYCFKELFEYWHPGHNCLTDKSADDFTITLDKPDRFATITCRGIDGTWTGAVDVSWDGILYVDDLVRDRQHSLSTKRMNETFQEYLNKMVDRKSGFDPQDGSFAGACELMVGTLWNVLDPLERIRKKYEKNPLYRFRRIPALNENEESNFNYKINGFTTEYYKEIRDRLDKAEWEAKYQQRPFVREGLLFPVEETKTFDGIIRDEGTVSTIGVCDPSVGGGDYLSFPITRYTSKGRLKYVIAWVYNKGTTKITIPKMVDKIIKYHVTEVHMEIDGVGSVVNKELKEAFEKRNITFCKIIPSHAPNRMSKEDKINGCSDYIKDNFVFLDDELDIESEFVKDSEYKEALGDMQMYTTEGKNEHDDAPDSIAQTSMVFKPLTENGSVDAFQNPMWGVGFGYYGGW